MKNVRTISSVLYYITRIISLFVLFIGVYYLVVMSFSLSTNSSNLPIEVKDNGTFIIFLPFTNTAFLTGSHTMLFFLKSISAVCLYGLFLWLLSSVFHRFRQQKLFTLQSVRTLERFYLFNLLIPVVIISLSFIDGEINDVVVVMLLHILIAVFTFFMAVIFKQGLMLQEEQDLTL